MIIRRLFNAIGLGCQARQMGLCSDCRMPVFADDGFIEYAGQYVHDECVAHRLGFIRPLRPPPKPSDAKRSAVPPA